VQAQRGEWHGVIERSLADAQQRGEDWQIEVEFFTAVLAILDSQSPALADGHPYAAAIAAIQRGIAAGGQPAEAVAEEVLQAVRAFVNADDWAATRQVVESHQAILFRPQVAILFEQNIAAAAGEDRQFLEQHLQILRDCQRDGIAPTFDRLIADAAPELPFDAALIPRSVAALLGTPQEKLKHAQFLATVAAGSDDEQLKQLITALQTALFGAPLASLGHDLNGVYRQAWEAILSGINRERDSVKP
jgi:hypothetical protein